MNKITVVILIGLTVLTAFLHLYKLHDLPPCLNSDEAAFGYNAFSLLKTGRDEYGTLLPTRLKSFGENKLPLMAYLDIPFVQIFGLNELSTRMPVILIGILSPLLLYLLAKEVTDDDKSVLATASLAVLSPWIQTISRHAHEVVLAYFFITFSLIFLLKFVKKQKILYFLLFSVFNGLALFSQHIAKLFTVFFLGYIIVLFVGKKIKTSFIKALILFMIFIIPVGFFAVTEIAHPTNRIATLFYLDNKGFSHNLFQLLEEQNKRLIYNKATQSVLYLTNQYLTYFSPLFLSVHGDSDPRFGLEGISPISVVEYLFIFIGLYYLFRNKSKHRYLLLALLFFSPLTAVTTWLEPSLTRSFYLIVPVLIIAGYGVSSLFADLRTKKFGLLGIGFIVFAYFFYSFYSWNFYFSHYPKRPLVIHAWQCGYKEIVSYVSKNYNKFDTFYITDKHGPPYIYLLFYLTYPPASYQKQANLVDIDEMGFGTVKSFDKFVLSFRSPVGTPKKTAIIGYSDDFSSLEDFSSDRAKTENIKINVGGEEIFQIYENPR